MVIGLSNTPRFCIKIGKELLMTLRDIKLELNAVMRIFSPRKDSNRVPSKYLAEMMTTRLFVR